MTLAPQGTPLWKTDYKAFAPRAGAADHVSQKWGLVLRGGAGLFYDLGNGPALIGVNSWPFSRTKRLGFVPWPLDDATAQPPPISLDPPFGNLPSLSDPNLKLPYSAQWNLALEKSLGPNQTFSATYVGQTSRRLLRRETFLDLRTINPDFTTASLTTNGATSKYNALQTQFQRRLSRGLQALVNYTWSHAIDDLSNSNLGSLPDEFLAQLGQGLQASADFDIRHSFTAAVTYQIPSPAAAGAGKAVLGNWSVDSIVRARSGTPINVEGSAVVQGLFITLRPDLVPGEPIWINDPSVPAGKRLNLNAFFLPAGRGGNLGRNSFKGFGASQVDFALRRRFTLSERTSLQFRADFFNIFNHPNFSNPPPFISGSTLSGTQSVNMLASGLGRGGDGGGLTPLFQIGGPRSIQFALKIIF